MSSTWPSARCDARVASGGYSFRTHQCCRNAKVSDSTGNWCTQHDPKRKLTRMHAQQAEWAAERAAAKVRKEIASDSIAVARAVANLNLSMVDDERVRELVGRARAIPGMYVPPVTKATQSG